MWSLSFAVFLCLTSAVLTAGCGESGQDLGEAGSGGEAGAGGTAGIAGGGGTQPADFEIVVLSADGGEYVFDNGIRLTIPPGAVNQDTEIALRLVPEAELVGTLNAYGQTTKTVLAAMQAKHPGVSFAKPVTLSLPYDGTLPPSALPYLVIVDIANQIYTLDTSAIPEAIAQKAARLPNPASKFVEYDCENNIVVIANLDALPSEERALVAAGIHELRKESDCFENPCRCCQIRVQEQSVDIAREGGAGDCFNSSIKGSVQYLSCGDGQLTEAYEIVETSIGKIEFQPEELELQVAAGALVSVKVVDSDGKEIPFYTIRNVTSELPEVATAGAIELAADRFHVLAHRSGETKLTVTFDCSITRELTVKVLPIEVLTDKEDLIVVEGGTASFQARLDGPPPDDTEVLLAVSHDGGDPDITVDSGALLMFDASNWSQYQQVMLAADEDSDAENGDARISLSALSLTSTLVNDRTVSVREADNDVLQLVTSSGQIFVPEGRNASFAVRLSNQPLETLSVSVEHAFGDTDLAIESGTELSFTVADWDQGKPVTLRAAEDDDDIIDGVATIRVSDDAGLLPSVDVRATEIDNDSSELLVTPGALCIERNKMANLSVLASTPVDFATLEWTSSDETVATVDQTGIVTATGDGPVRIDAVVDGASAHATVHVREHCFSVSPASTCLHAPISEQKTIGTSVTDLIPALETALAGHRVSYASSNEAVATVDVTGRLEAKAGGTATISVDVDNVITNYQREVDVVVATDIFDYSRVGVKHSTGPIFLTDDREIYTHAQIVQRVEEEASWCGGFPSAPDRYRVSDFNNQKQYIGHSGEDGEPLPFGDRMDVGLYLDADLCLFEKIRVVSWDEDALTVYASTIPNAINDLGQVVGTAWTWPIVDLDANWTGNSFAMTRETGVEFPFPFSEIDGERSLHYFYDINNQGKIVFHIDGDGTSGNVCLYGTFDTSFGVNPPDPASQVAFDIISDDCVDEPVAINNHGVVIGNTKGPGEDGFFYFENEFYAPPIASLDYELQDINDAQDVLGSSDAGRFLMHICPFSLETNVCDWISDEDRQAIKGYEEFELSCDGLDNDCDGDIDEGLLGGPTWKQRGVCYGAFETCKGRLGWVADYSKVPDYEFPETSCDGKDNDCDGVEDEDCD